MRRRIISVAVVTALLATLVFGVPLGVFAAQFFLDRERGYVEGVAESAAVSVAADLASGGIPPALSSADPEVGLALYGADGSLASGRGPEAARASVRDALAGRLTTDSDAGGYLVVAVPVTDGTRVVGVVLASTGYAEVRWQIVGSWAVMLGFAVGAVVSAGLLARRLARRLAEPLEALSSAAQRLGDGDFSVRARASGIREIDAVSSSLGMTAVRLDDLVRRERELAANASHQLRTPLTALRLVLETAVDQPPPVQARALETAIEAADRLERTIADLLQLAHDDARSRDTLDLAQLVAEAAAAVSLGLAGVDRPLSVHVEEDLPVVTGSSAAVRQVLGVLLDNASVHGAGAVSIHVREASGAVAIDVGDEGDGVPDPSALFADRRPPRDADRSGGPGGIGLGLARALGEDQGGRLSLSRASPPVFTLLLPVEGDGTPAAPRAPGASAALVRRAAAGGRQVALTGRQVLAHGRTVGGSVVGAGGGGDASADRGMVLRGLPRQVTARGRAAATGARAAVRRAGRKLVAGRRRR